MFRTSLSTVALSGALIAAPFAAAFAADMTMPYKAPPPPPPANVWTGWYVGAEGGYAWGDDPTSTTGVFLLGAGGALQPGSGSLHADGGLLGVEAGYNWQFAAPWLLGIETDFQYTDIHGSANCIVACNTGLPPVGSGYTQFTVTDKLNWFGTVRGRLGYTWGSSLLYATGGFAYGNVERTGLIIGSGPGGRFGGFAGSYDDTSTRTGWTVGGGLETKLWGSWSAWTAKAEYLYVDLGNVSDTLNMAYASGAPGAIRNVSSEIRENIFRVGLNYQFH